MIGAYFANEDYSSQATPNGGWTPNGSWSETYSTKCKSASKKTLIDNLGWSPSGCTFAAHTFVSGASAGISATAIANLAEGEVPIRNGDTGICNGSFTNNSSGATVPCSCNLSITNAGQSKDSGN